MIRIIEDFVTVDMQMIVRHESSKRKKVSELSCTEDEGWAPRSRHAGGGFKPP